MRFPHRRIAFFAVALALGLCVHPPVARAESQEELARKLKEQMQKIVELMKENEEALLEASTGARARAHPVDVKVPDLPPAGGHAKGGDATSPGAQGKAKGKAKGKDAARSLEELIRNQRRTAGQIPRGLEELVQMVPRRASGQGGQGSPDAKQPKPKPRDIRKKLDETSGKQKPKDGQDKKPRRPRDPNQRSKDQPSAKTGKGEDRKDGTPSWVVALPPQWRDAYVRGDFEKIPPQYRDLIEKYLIWLQREAARKSPGGD